MALVVRARALPAIIEQGSLGLAFLLLSVSSVNQFCVNLALGRNSGFGSV